jgi:hypothetical protein
MKAEVILVSQLDDFLKFVQKERELQIRMTRILEYQERTKKELELVKQLAQFLLDTKRKHGFKTEEEMTKLIKKYAVVG